MKNNKIEILNQENNPTISVNDEKYFTVSFKVEKFVDEKEMIKFIKNIERQIRSSPEYRTLCHYFKVELNFNSCAYLNNLTSDEVSIELHHNPYTLFDLVQIMINKYEAHNVPFNSFMIASDVMLLHYNNLVGLLPLSKTIHELAHNAGKFMIHKDLHIGLVDKFYQQYKDYMNDDLKMKYTSWIKYSDEFKDDKFNGLNLFDNSKRNLYLTDISDINDPQLEAPNLDDDDEEYPEIEGIQNV